MNDTKDNTYQQRNSGVNIAEQRFEMYCRNRKIEFHHFGFDEKKENITNFYFIHPLLRSLPDYVIPVKKRIYFIQVKGTMRVKTDDLAHYKKFEEMFCNENCFFYFYFCFADGVHPYSLDKIIDMTKNLPLKKYSDSGKEYYELPI